MIIGLLLIIIIGLVFYIYKLKQQKLTIIQLNEEVKQQNQLIEKELNENNTKLFNLKSSIQDENNILQSLITSSEELRTQAENRAQEAYEAKMSALRQVYEKEKLKLDEQSQQQLAIIISQIEEQKEKLSQIEGKQLAYIKAQQRQEEINSNKDYYRLAIDEIDISDIALLRELQPKFTKKESIDKLIWEVYYKPAYDILTARLFPKAVKNCGIYKITDLTTGKAYIGQSVDIKERFRQHIKSALTYGKSTNKLYQTMQKSGVHNFTFEILEEVPRTSLNEREIYWIEFYKTKEFGLNGTRGGS